MIDLRSPALIGVVHLPALPGSASNLLSMAEIIDRALSDARALQDCSFDALIVENFGDVPFSKDTLHPGAVACMSIAVDRIRREVSLPVGVNALRNDARAALGIAVATGASFIRVNVHSGVSATDQGLIEGRADETLLYRKRLGVRVAILADVHVKHARPISEPDLASAARDTAYRSLADGLIVTGTATGEPVSIEDLRCVVASVPDRRVFVGSGATKETVGSLLQSASGVIVGTALKVDGKAANPIDPEAAMAFARAAGRT